MKSQRGNEFPSWACDHMANIIPDLGGRWEEKEGKQTLVRGIKKTLERV